jgi:hypothetical protein
MPEKRGKMDATAATGLLLDKGRRQAMSDPDRKPPAPPPAPPPADNPADSHPDQSGIIPGHIPGQPKDPEDPRFPGSQPDLA